MYKNFIKRFLDFVIACFALLLFSPIFIIVMISLFFANKGKPFFFQKRSGKNGQDFSIIKFKTMNDRRGADGELLPDTDRLTPVGKLVRKTSLDEVPQLLNVIKGEMSLVGFRPFLAEYLPLYSDYQKQRFDVRPGITGLAQVRGRNRLKWTHKLRYDVFYTKHVSFGLDLWIMLQTILKIFKVNDVNQSDEVVADKFTGFN